jgi:hypothetical protein
VNRKPLTPHAARAAAAALFCAGSVITARFTTAGVVEPGKTVVLNERELPAPEGQVLAKSVLPFSLDYQPGGNMGDFVDFSGTAEGTLTSTVVREQGRGGLLTFLYDIDLNDDANVGIDASADAALTVDSFRSFTTDVAGALDRERSILASRTGDGAGVKISSDDPNVGMAGAPRLIVRTDATDFDRDGTARFFATDELAVRTPDGLKVDLASGTVIVGGTFQPVDDVMPPVQSPDPEPPTPPAAIPLPPGIGMGLVGLVLVGWRARKSKLPKS